MNQWNKVSNETKINIYEQLSEKTGLAPYAVEKDWWVVKTLALVFEMEIGNQLVFKGGTSLSKAWNLIARFSEDIDLAVNRSFFGFEGNLGKNQRDKLRKTANEYITTTFYKELKEKFEKEGLSVDVQLVEITSSDQNPIIIEVYYPSLMTSSHYISPKVQIEIGCRSLIEPFTIKNIKSLVDEEYAHLPFAEEGVNIPTVNPERTFLEKLFLLHEEFQKPQEQIRVNRLSRHLYDVNALFQSSFCELAIDNQQLYQTIVQHRYQFTRIPKIDYQLHQPQTINPLPSIHVIEAWKKDYKLMQEQMIYGDSPSFEHIIENITKLTHQLNNLEWTIDI